MVKNTAKSSYKDNFFYCNILVFIGLVYIYYTLNRSVEEGVTNMNCCGGVEAGIHYSETDTQPPPYIRRCFKSSRETDGINYKWSGFPCSNTTSKDCCRDTDGGDRGECIPTTGGGYCKKGDNSRIFNRGTEISKPYIMRGNDKILDIEDTIDMKDYFFARRAGDKNKAMNPGMQRFMARRSKNEKYMEQHVVNKKQAEVTMNQAKKDELNEKKKYRQVVSSITIIHLLALVAISITIRHDLTAKIQGVLNFISQKYLEFSGGPAPLPQ